MKNALANVPGGPAIIVGAIVAAVLAIVQSLTGDGVLGQDLADTINRALAIDGGWVWPIVGGILTRLFVSPSDTVGWK